MPNHVPTRSSIKAAIMLGLVGAAVGGASIAHAQAPATVNVTGATLFQSFFTAPQSTFDAIDANGNGNARLAPPFNGVVEQLAPQGVNPSSGWWAVQYRAVGSGNGLQELVNYGTRFASGPADIANIAPNLENAWCNRTQYYSNATGNQADFNANNPGGAPFRTNTTTLLADTTTGGVRIDAAIMDVPTKWFVRVNGAGSPTATPLAAGYGNNLKNALAKDGTAALPVQANRLRTLTSTDGLVTLNTNTSSPDASTIFDTPIAAAPIAFMVNYGTGHQQMTYTQLRHLFVTGRLPSGENLMAVTRDVGSGTRNGAMNSIGVDPSWGMGENVGTKNDDTANDPNDRCLAGPNFLPSNKGGSGTMERTVLNCRLAVGTTGAERGITSSWLLNHRCELLGVRNDIGGGTAYARPTIGNLLDNNLNGYNVEGPESFATIGDPRASDASSGGTGWTGAFDPYIDANSNNQYDLGEPFTDKNGNGVRDAQNAEAGLTNTNPAMRSSFGAQYLNNISRSIEAFVNFSGQQADFTPGQFLAQNFILVAATDYVPNPTDPKNLIPNPNLNQALQDTVRTANTIFTNNAYNAFDNSASGIIPLRTLLTTGTYTDGSTQAYRQLSGATLGLSVANIPERNRIAADLNQDGVRTLSDIPAMVAAWRSINGGPAWTPATGIYASATGTIALDLLGDLNNDGRFDRADVRYFADGLALNTSGNLDRKAAFTAVDAAFNGNFFGTTLACGTYTSGATRADIAGAVGVTPGFAPTGQDGIVNAKDIDYVFRQFKQNPAITDGAANWSSLSEAANFDLSADLTGDLIVDQADITELVTVILGTSMGDVNLDGSVTQADLDTATTFLGQTGGWAKGDVNGDGTITQADLDIIGAFLCPGNTCGSQDFNGDGDFGTDQDIEAFFACLGGNCCTTCFCQGSDFNGDGDFGTDQDIEAFFRVLGGGSC